MTLQTLKMFKATKDMFYKQFEFFCELTRPIMGLREPRPFLGNIPEIFNHLLQRSRILFGQYCCVLFMQKKCAIRLQMKKCHTISIYHKGSSVWNSKTVRNSKNSLYNVYEPRHEKMCLPESPTRQETN